MDKFEPVNAENILEALPYFAVASERICDDTAGVTYQWRKLFKTDILIREGCLVTRSTFPQVGMCYSFPIGAGDPIALIPFLKADAQEKGIQLRFACVTEERLRQLRTVIGNRVQAEDKRNWADYLYDPTCFEYSGNKFHTQKNHVNRFYREHPEAKLVPLADNNKDEVSDFLDYILATKTDMPDWEKGEVEGTQDLLLKHKELHQIGAFLRTNEGIAAFSIGEIRGDTLHVHAEKANTMFPGAYPAIAQAFAAYAAKGVQYINREDDAGDPGIRYSKEQYRPICLIPKYLVTMEGI